MDMKKILQSLDSVATKPVEGANDMKRFLQVINEGSNPHKVSLPVQMAMQHYQQPVAKAKPRARLIDKYFTEAEASILQKKQEEKALLKQYAQVIAERILMKENGPAFNTTGGGAATGYPNLIGKRSNQAQSQIAVSIQGEGLDTNIVVNGIEIYGVKDFLFDLGLAAAIVALGTALAAPSGGSSEMIAAAALANPVRRIFTYVVRYAAHVAKTQTLTKEAISAWVKSRADIFLKLFKETLAPIALKATVEGTIIFNTVAGILEKYNLLPDWMKKDKPFDPANPEASVQLK